MLIYEVNIAIDSERAQEFELWLADHIEQMLCVDGFVGARVFHVEESGPGKVNFVVHYDLESRDKLEAYFVGSAERLRAAGIEKFGASLEATRRVLMRQ